MFDDWEIDNYEIQMPTSYTKEQIKKIQERILVEESDIGLSRELFKKEEPKNILQYEYNNATIQQNINTKMEKQKKNNQSLKIVKEHKIFKKQTEKNNNNNKNRKKNNDNIDNFDNIDNSYFCDDYLDYEDKHC